MHGGKSPGAPIGNSNALKHGLYSAEAIARRRELAVLALSVALAMLGPSWSGQAQEAYDPPDTVYATGAVGGIIAQAKSSINCPQFLS